MIKTTAKRDFDGAMLQTREYLMQLQKERANAEEAIIIARSILSGQTHTKDLPVDMKRKEVSEYLGVTMDALRNWERNGLLAVKRKQNGYRVYTNEDIQRLKIIRSLRCANYSLEAIFQMLQQLEKDPGADMREALNLSEQSDDIVSVCDKLLVSLSAAEENAHTMMAMLQEMKKSIAAPNEYLSSSGGVKNDADK